MLIHNKDDIQFDITVEFPCFCGTPCIVQNDQKIVQMRTECYRLKYWSIEPLYTWYHVQIVQTTNLVQKVIVQYVRQL